MWYLYYHQVYSLIDCLLFEVIVHLHPIEVGMPFSYPRMIFLGVLVADFDLMLDVPVAALILHREEVSQELRGHYTSLLTGVVAGPRPRFKSSHVSSPLTFPGCQKGRLASRRPLPRGRKGAGLAANGR